MFSRKLVGIGAAALLAAAFVVGTAGAASANTTLTFHSTQLSGAIPVTCDGPVGATVYQGTGNSVAHETINNAGDSWITTTSEGDVQLQTIWNGVTGTWTGHLQTWFGSEQNKQNSVTHATFNFQGVSATDPSMTLAMHAAFTDTINANGVQTVNNMTVSCR